MTKSLVHITKSRYILKRKNIEIRENGKNRIAEIREGVEYPVITFILTPTLTRQTRVIQLENSYKTKYLNN